MGMMFNNLVEEIKNSTNEEKEELKFLIEKYLIENRRDEIYKNYQKSKKEQKRAKLHFSKDIEELKRML